MQHTDHILHTDRTHLILHLQEEDMEVIKAIKVIRAIRVVLDGHSSHGNSKVTHNSHSSASVNGGQPTTPSIESTPTFQEPQIPPETPQIK